MGIELSSWATDNAFLATSRYAVNYFLLVDPALQKIGRFAEVKDMIGVLSFQSKDTLTILPHVASYAPFKAEFIDFLSQVGCKEGLVNAINASPAVIVAVQWSWVTSVRNAKGITDRRIDTETLKFSDKKPIKVLGVSLEKFLDEKIMSSAELYKHLSETYDFDKLFQNASENEIEGVLLGGVKTVVDIVSIKPSLFGISVDFNKIIKKLFLESPRLKTM